MHTFGTDSDERNWVFLGLIPISFLLSDWIRRFLEFFHISIGGRWDFIAEPTSAAFCFAVLSYLFNRRLWKWKFLHTFGLVKVPNIDGVWEGYLKSSYNDYASKFYVTLKIQQNWTAIQIRQFHAGSSKSYSESASILVDANEGIRISYEYRNDPNQGQPDSMASHRGTAVIILDESIPRMLVGDYYTSRGRRNIGTMTLWEASMPVSEIESKRSQAEIVIAQSESSS